MIAKNLKEWRKIVLDRDKYTCQICGQPANIADHILARRVHQELVLEIDNGRGLCIKCHSKNGSKVLCKSSNRNSILQLGGSHALILPPSLSVGTFASIVDIGPIIIVDPKGKLEKEQLEEFAWSIAPIFWEWHERKKQEIVNNNKKEN